MVHKGHPSIIHHHISQVDPDWPMAHGHPMALTGIRRRHDGLYCKLCNAGPILSTAAGRSVAAQNDERYSWYYSWCILMYLDVVEWTLEVDDVLMIFDGGWCLNFDDVSWFLNGCWWIVDDVLMILNVLLIIVAGPDGSKLAALKLHRGTDGRACSGKRRDIRWLSRPGTVTLGCYFRLVWNRSKCLIGIQKLEGNACERSWYRIQDDSGCVCLVFWCFAIYFDLFCCWWSSRPLASLNHHLGIDRSTLTLIELLRSILELWSWRCRKGRKHQRKAKPPVSWLQYHPAADPGLSWSSDLQLRSPLKPNWHWV